MCHTHRPCLYCLFLVLLLFVGFDSRMTILKENKREAFIKGGFFFFWFSLQDEFSHVFILGKNFDKLNTVFEVSSNYKTCNSYCTRHEDFTTVNTQEISCRWRVLIHSRPLRPEIITQKLY